jgi:hypothetical protein
MSKVKDKIAALRAPKPKGRKPVQVRSQAAAEAVKRGWRLEDAIRTVSARTFALADEVEAAQDATASTARKVRDIAAKLPAIEAQRPADAHAVAALIAKWQADYQARCDGIWAEYLTAAEKVTDDAEHDAVVDATFDGLEAAKAIYDMDRTEALPDSLPTTDSIMQEWDREKAAITAAWHERHSHYRTDAAYDAGYDRYSAAWDAAEDRAQARWDAADDHEVRVAQFIERYGLADDDKVAVAMRGMSEAILALRIQYIEADAQPPAPFDGYCEFYLDHDDEVKIGGLTVDEFVDAYMVALRDVGRTPSVRFESATTTMEIGGGHG